jgi:hypothetical protein
MNYEESHIDWGFVIGWTAVALVTVAIAGGVWWLWGAIPMLVAVVAIVVAIVVAGKILLKDEYYGSRERL